MLCRFRPEYIALLTLALALSVHGNDSDTAVALWGNRAQANNAPFSLNVQPAEDGAGVVTVIVHGKDGATFKSLVICAREKESETCLGRFVDLAEGLQVNELENGATNITSPVSLATLSLKWTPTDQNVADVTFTATIVDENVRRRTNIKTPFFSIAGEKSVGSDTEEVKVEILTSEIDFHQCGKSKGCFLYPRQCSGTDCVAAATYVVREDSQDILVELFSSSADVYHWIGLGLSKDKQMGGDETFSCVANQERMNIQQGYNPAYYNVRLPTKDLSDAELLREDNWLWCRFRIPLFTWVDFQEKSIFQSFNLNQSHHLFLAWGPAVDGTGNLGFHTEMPAVSDLPIYMRYNIIQRGSAFRPLVHAHAVTMMIAWIILAGIVTIISRHFKNWMPDKIWLGTKVWFQIHRALAISVAVLTGLGLVFIFSQYGPGIRKEAIPHAYFGIAVSVGVSLQIIMGLLRPGHDHPLRKSFNGGHFLLGQATHILAAVTMFLAFNIEYINQSMRRMGVAFLVIWVVVQIGWHVLFEVIRCRHKKTNNPETMSLTKDDGGFIDASKQETSSYAAKQRDHLYSSLFAVYVLSLTAICFGCIMSFVLY